MADNLKNEQEKYPFIHSIGDDPCNKIAFYFSKKPEPNDILYASSIEYIDGTHPEPGGFARCSSCKKILQIFRPGRCG